MLPEDWGAAARPPPPGNRSPLGLHGSTAGQGQRPPFTAPAPAAGSAVYRITWGEGTQTRALFPPTLREPSTEEGAPTQTPADMRGSPRVRPHPSGGRQTGRLPNKATCPKAHLLTLQHPQNQRKTTKTKAQMARTLPHFTCKSNFFFPRHVAHGILVPGPGIEPGPLAVTAHVLTTGPSGNPHFRSISTRCRAQTHT